MQKKRFSKKKILGIVKSYHAKKRQVERDITDQQLVKVLQHGELDKRSEYEIIITLDGYFVYLSHDLEKIITVTCPDVQETAPKIISPQEAKNIKDSIVKIHKKEVEATNRKNEEEMTFEEYMKKNF